MSILIKMEMPKNCVECKFKWPSIGTVLGNDNMFYCMFTHSIVIQAIEQPFRSINCPLVELSPHGRLIDADAYGKDLRETIDECFKWAEEVKEGEMYARVSQSLATFVECSLRAKAAPTIIEAETCNNSKETCNKSGEDVVNANNGAEGEEDA